MVQGAVDMQIVIDIITTLLSAFGAIVLVLILFRIEARARARDREIRKAAAAPRAEPGTVAARPGGVSWEMAAAGSAAHPDATTRSPVPPPAGPEGLGAPPGGIAHPSAGAPVGARMVPGPLGFEPALPRDPAGPRLHLRVQGPDSMIATLDGESEAITLADLPETASAIARADGSAVIATEAAGAGAASPGRGGLQDLCRRRRADHVEANGGAEQLAVSRVWYAGRQWRNSDGPWGCLRSAGRNPKSRDDHG